MSNELAANTIANQFFIYIYFAFTADNMSQVKFVERVRHFTLPQLVADKTTDIRSIFYKDP